MDHKGSESTVFDSDGNYQIGPDWRILTIGYVCIHLVPGPLLSL